MSWFSLGAIDDIKNKVQAAMPAIDNDMLDKLTLTTPELTAERRRIDEEEKRKERVRDSLSGMLPWETRDNERDILVEECKEAVLLLSSREETFTGPYAMPKPTPNEEEEDSVGGDDKGDSEKPYQGPSEESLARLAKLEPLPPLLGEFDLDSHVGLIQRLMEIDPKLVEMQSKLSGGGDKEKTFWRNYFFHCAWTRYEAGLSIDEIWSDQPQTSENEPNDEAANDSASDEITFEAVAPAEPPEKDGGDLFSAPVAAVQTPDPKDSNSANLDSLLSPGIAADSSDVVDGLSGADFELVAGMEDDSNSDVDSELDELEAEIARELED